MLPSGEGNSWYTLLTKRVFQLSAKDRRRANLLCCLPRLVFVEPVDRLETLWDHISSINIYKYSLNNTESQEQKNLVAVASNLRAMASNLVAMASNLRAMASNLVAMASNLRAMASNLRAMVSNLSSDGLQLLELLVRNFFPGAIGAVPGTRGTALSHGLASFMDQGNWNAQTFFIGFLASVSALS